MKRSKVTIEEIADWNNLCQAAALAARGKRDRQQLRHFFDDFSVQISQLSDDIRHETIRLGNTTRFEVFDPKRRIIHAPIFRERVFHHALMRHVGPVLDRALIDDTYACRVDKGAIAAVFRAQQHSRRFPWFAKIDVRQYFPSIDQTLLLQMLAKRFKDGALLRLLEKVVKSHEFLPGKGLPIGALTSQHFANFYLSVFDRLLLEESGICGLIRYMDDTVFWCETKQDVQRVLTASREYLQEKLYLSLHDHCQINRSTAGVTVCGYRVFPGMILLTQRRRNRYRTARLRWEKRFARGEITAQQLQAGYAAALGIVSHANSLAWRREQLLRVPVLESCEEA